MKNIWKNRKKILEGLINWVTGKYRKIAKERQEICKACVHYDKHGISDNVVIKGKPACDICGCSISLLSHAMSASCSLEDIDKVPKWKAYEESK